MIFKNCAPFVKCIIRINNTEIDHAKDIDIVMYNLIEYSDSYSKTSGSLWQYYKDVPDKYLADSELFKYKVKITGNSPADGNTKDAEIIVPIKYLSNFWRTLEMPLINYEVNLKLIWSKDCVITNSTGEQKFQITEAKLYVLAVTLLTQFNIKLLQQLKSAFKIVNWNKYELSVKTFAETFLIDGRYFFDQPINNMNKTYENIRKIATGKGDDYTTGCLLDYPYFKDHYKMIAIDLSKQQALDADPKKIQQINFTANLGRAGNTTIFFIIEPVKETIFEFSQGTVKVL